LPSSPFGNVQPLVTPPDVVAVKFRKKSNSNPKFKSATRAVISGKGTQELGRIAATVILVVTMGTAIGWAVKSPVVRNAVIRLSSQNTKDTNKPVQPQMKSVSKEIANYSAIRSGNRVSQDSGVEPIPLDHNPNGAQTRAALIPPQMPRSERPAARPTDRGAVARTVSSPSKSQSAQLSKQAAILTTNPEPVSAGRLAVESSPKQSPESPAILSANPPLSPHFEPVPAVAKENALPLVKQPEAPVSVTWSVAVTTDPYPSIRIPPDVGSQKATGGRSLQIGHVLSRVDPAYPEDAKRQGIEGTVKLHVVVGRDGAVLSAAPISGPASLANAATSAVREWRYAQTLLGGQPVETEQDVVIKFRLMSQ